MQARILIPNDNLTDERKQQLIDQLALLQEKIDAEVEFVNPEDIPERKEEEVQIFRQIPILPVDMMAPMGYYPSGKEARRARREREREARKKRR